MQPENFRFGGGSSGTMIHPIVLIAMLVAVVLIFALKRKYVIIPFFLLIFLSPQGQVLVMGGMHVFVYRILILVGCLRFISGKFSSRTEICVGGLNILDRCFMAWATARALAPILLFMQGGAVVNSFGWVWDTFGGYFLLRFLIRDKEDIYRTLKTLGAITIILAACVMNEKFRHQNVFGYLGGVSIVPDFRDGQYRPEAAFSHPLLLGTFAASFLPLFLWLWRSGHSKLLGILGSLSSTAITVASASSTPLMAYAAGVLGMCFWPLRKKMRVIRWGIVILLVSLHLVMKAPVWFIITHIDIIGASSGYHRAALIDMFIKHFRDWWVIGTNDNAKWGWDMYDLANEYVAEGEAGGLVSFACFIGLISICFSWIGKGRKLVEGDQKEERFLWSLGSALFANVVGFFGISYFDQTRFSWFALLICISIATVAVWRTDTVLEPQPDRPSERVPVPSRSMKPSAALASNRSVTSRRWTAPTRP